MSETIRCAGAIVFDARSHVLLVRRANEPGAGLWSVPGGRCRPGESSADACVREVAEETGLAVRIVRLAGSVIRDAPSGATYAIDDFVCEVEGGDLTAGDDADEARWVSASELVDLDMTDGLASALQEWDLWPR